MDKHIGRSLKDHLAMTSDCLLLFQDKVKDDFSKMEQKYDCCRKEIKDDYAKMEHKYDCCRKEIEEVTKNAKDFQKKYKNLTTELQATRKEKKELASEVKMLENNLKQQCSKHTADWQHETMKMNELAHDIKILDNKIDSIKEKYFQLKCLANTNHALLLRREREMEQQKIEFDRKLEESNSVSTIVAILLLIIIVIVVIFFIYKLSCIMLNYITELLWLSFTQLTTAISAFRRPGTLNEAVMM
jgi:predicted  nucleic acid-binding Zn-ribbon protein